MSSASPRAAPATALVHDWLTGMRGGEKVLEAIAGWFPEAPIFTLFHFPGSVSPAIESHPIHTSQLQGAPLARRHYRSYLPLFPTAVEEFDLSAYDLVISSSHCVAKGALPRPDAVHLCYCHTPMRYAWDQERAYFPRRTGPVARLRAWVLARLREWDVATAPRVDHFVANSSFVAERIRRYYGREAEVVHPPADTEFFTPCQEDRRREERPYALFVAALAPYKKVEVAIAACAGLGLELRVVGDGPQRARLEREAAAGTRFLGRVSDEDLRRLYRGASCMVQPGIEDFGIAAVEALACGCPVVARGEGGVLDIVRDGQEGVLYRVDSEAGAAGAMAKAIDKCRQIGFNSLNLSRRAADFSAARFGDRLRTVLCSRVPHLEI